MGRRRAARAGRVGRRTHARARLPRLAPVVPRRVAAERGAAARAVAGAGGGAHPLPGRAASGVDPGRTHRLER